MTKIYVGTSGWSYEWTLSFESLRSHDFRMFDVEILDHDGKVFYKGNLTPIMFHESKEMISREVSEGFFEEFKTRPCTIFIELGYLQSMVLFSEEYKGKFKTQYRAQGIKA